MTSIHRAFWLCAVVLALVLGPSLVAQTTNASIVGIITDASEAAVPGAAVSVTNTGTGVSRTTATNDAGAYTIPTLIPGTYDVKVTNTGFKTQVQSNIVLQTGAVVKVDFKLEVGAVSESIEVAATATLLQTQEASVAGVVTTSQLERIPVNGRNFTRLILLMPGTSDVPAGQQIGQSSVNVAQPTVAGLQMASVNGQRQSDNDYTIDGVDNNIMYKSSVSGAPPMDSIQEFRVATNNSAEYGRNSGANVNLSTKSGTRDLHGAAYEYLRNDKTDANDWFANRQGRGKVPFHQNQYGVALGGPLYIPKVATHMRESTFWFFNWEGFRFRRGNTLINSTPVAAQRTGDFSMIANTIYDPLTGKANASGGVVREPFAGNKIPQSRLNPAMTYLVNLAMPLPNAGGLSNNLVDSTPTQNDRDYIVARGDRNIGNKDVIYGRYLRQKVGQFTPSGYLVRSNQIRIDVDNVGAAWIHTFSPTMVLEVRYGLNRPNSPACDNYIEGITRAGALSKAGISMFDPTAACGPLPGFNAQSFTVGGGGGETVVDTDHQFDGKVSKMVGAHSLKMGAGYWIRNMDATFANPTNGTATFNNILTSSADNSRSGDPFATLLLGYPSTIQRGLGIPFAQGRQKYTLAYFQDDWRVSSRLTVNLGVRWDGYDRPHDAEDKLGNVLIVRDPQTGKYQGLLQWAGVNPLVDPVTGKSGLGPQTFGYGRTLMVPRWKNFAPRVGLAYQIDSKTVFRAAFGMFYNTTFMQELNDLRKMWPYLPQQTWNPNTGTVLPDLSITDPGPSFNSTQALGGWPQNSNNRTPYSQQWNAFFQRELQQNLTLEIGYVGSANRDQIGYHEVNSAYAPGPGPVDPRRQVQGFGSMQMGENVMSSEYNAMQVKANRRFSSGLQIMANYTWGKSMDDQSTLGTYYKWVDFHNRRADWSRSFYDIKHAFKLSYVYDLPFGKGRHFGGNWKGVTDFLAGGWAAEGMAAIQSGQPIYVRTGSDYANIGTSYERPNVLRNPNLPVGQRTVDRWFDTSAFVTPQPFTFGNAGAMIVEADGRQVFDVSIAKKFPIREKQAVTFRAEFFNLPNHINFGNPSGPAVTGGGAAYANMSSGGSFGTVTYATAARQIQFALRYTF